MGPGLMNLVRLSYLSDRISNSRRCLTKVLMVLTAIVIAATLMSELGRIRRHDSYLLVVATVHEQ